MRNINDEMNNGSWQHITHATLKVLEYVFFNNAVNTTQIATGTGLSMRSVQEHVKFLRERNVVKRANTIHGVLYGIHRQWINGELCFMDYNEDSEAAWFRAEAAGAFVNE